jgi:uncharacterized protein YyaL (SSP411 family)
MLAAFAEAAGVLNDDNYLSIARGNADFLLRELRRDGRLLRTWKNGAAKLNGYIEDYANLADGLIELYQASGETKYLAEAKRLADVMIKEFWDEENGGFYFTSNDHEELIVRSKDLYDNATPSGNSVAADVLLRLSKFFQDERYDRYATTVLRLSSQQAARYPNGFGRALATVEFALGGSREVVVVGPKGNDLERSTWENYLPGKILITSDDPDRDAKIIPLLAGREMRDGKATAFVCENFTCQLPVTTVGDLENQLK